MKQLAYRILFFLRIFRIISFIFCRKKIVILMYHGFSESCLHEGMENSGDNQVFVEHFKQQVRFLKRFYTVVSLNEALEMLGSSRTIKRNTVVITIDDGYKSVFSVAFPVLKEHDIPATVFCATNFIKDRQYLWGDRLEYALNTSMEKNMNFRYETDNIVVSLATAGEKAEAMKLIKSRLKKGVPGAIPEAVRKIEHDLKASLDSTVAVPCQYLPLEMSHITEMGKSGIVSIGSHTASHAILSQCTVAEMEQELKESKKFLENILKVPVDLFCYPNGQEGDFNDETGEMVRKCGYACAVTTVDGMNTVRTAMYELKRYWVRSTIGTIPEFALLVCGLLSFMYRVKRNVLGLFA